MKSSVILFYRLALKVLTTLQNKPNQAILFYKNIVEVFLQLVSQTQLIASKITKIVQEICDIKQEATTCCRSSPRQEDTYGRGGEHCNNSSYNIPHVKASLTPKNVMTPTHRVHRRVSEGRKHFLKH